ncbi:hypothetical protein BGW36DRAFT_371332 [Talaromyces proteolyticus]|uniref:Transcription factor domain-containing protein n=1 Tax=Talaromyces proteolyticus TaxID=1131652 RepID=A0AAD4Q3E6_9EURO|nr:uncharacterized protein BGW36DRAFT_371332 [Talaromyces proteolyticus]KAH8701693.1 hypothetical protein BGW36DRAFT_371332 [Talaromyces proteolyticus]
MNAQASDGTVVEYPESSSSIPNQTIQGYQTSSLYVSIPPQPTSALRSLNQRPKIKTGTQQIAKLILHTLKSYPLMMLRDDSLPPYIHPNLISSNTENNQMEPLTNCISLVHMISSKAQGSRKLFWRNVRVECERLYQEYLKWSKWELLAAMQALSIYIIVRLDEGETDYNNFDSLLIRAVILIAQKFSAVEFACHTQSALTNYDIEVGWKDWIFEESRRRLAVVLRIVNMLVYFEPAALCELRTDLIIAPLPAKKQLWEAGNEVLWKAESQKEPADFQMVFGLDVNGDLVRMDERQLSCSHRMLPPKPSDLARKTTNWEEWCSGMDGFGGLVMLASSMALLV